MKIENPRRQRHRNAKWLAASAALAISSGACGSGPQPQTLFAGAPGELMPHEPGRTAHFLVRTTYGGRETSAILTSRVLHEGPDGEFIVENSFDDGRVRRLRVRETDRAIQLEAVARPAPGGLSWITLEEPATLAETPVVLGKRDERFFTRMIDLESVRDGERTRTTVAIEGMGTRTALPVQPLRFGDTTLSAIPFAIESTSRITGFVPGITDSLEFELRGVEYLSPGLGLVRESLELIILGSSPDEPRVTISTERLPSPPYPANPEIPTRVAPQRGSTPTLPGWHENEAA